MEHSLIGVYGTITDIIAMRSTEYSKILSLNTQDGIVNIVVSEETCIVDNVTLTEGMKIAAFYDANAPMLLIYPPQYNALIVEQIKL